MSAVLHTALTSAARTAYLAGMSPRVPRPVADACLRAASWLLVASRLVRPEVVRVDVDADDAIVAWVRAANARRGAA